jgi:hypothetical protein
LTQESQDKHVYQLYLKMHPLDGASDAVVPHQNVGWIPDVFGPGISDEVNEGDAVYVLVVQFEKRQRPVTEPESDVLIPKRDCRHEESETREIKALVLRRKGVVVHERVGIVGGGHWKDRESRDKMRVVQEETITII